MKNELKLEKFIICKIGSSSNKIMGGNGTNDQPTGTEKTIAGGSSLPCWLTQQGQ